MAKFCPGKKACPCLSRRCSAALGRKVLGPKILADVPIVLLAYDLLEWQGEDIREWPLERRREQLTALVQSLQSTGRIVLSAPVPFHDWEELTQLRLGSREKRVEGFMLKRHGSPYRVGRRRGDWWKWKIEPYSIDCVLIYAQPGNGRRASLLSDYTFGVWDNGELVPFAKAYSGLTNEEIGQGGLPGSGGIRLKSSDRCGG